jgi:hypothetical protein
MTDASLPARFAESEFRVGNVLNRTSSVLSRNFLIFFVVTAVAQLPSLLFLKTETMNPNASGAEIAVMVTLGIGGAVLMIVLSMLSQAIVLYGAFQNMRGREVSLAESLQVGLRRFWAILGMAFLVALLAGLAVLALIFPALILATMWFVAAPACVVEQLGPWASMRRSRELTKGHRWKVFGLMMLLLIISGIAGGTITAALTAIGGNLLAMVGTVLWNGAWGAFSAIAVVVTYHDLRAAKEGIDIDQIAAVFD